MELLLSEAKLPLPLAFASLCFSNGEPRLLQAQALRARISALLAGVKEGLSVFNLVCGNPFPKKIRGRRTLAL
jgi:hypothetical protein